jgi:phosphonate degradation associated HDIG domain protein
MQTDRIVALFEAHGAMSYDGEGVTQLQHGWQGARLAAQAGATPALQLAAWLHDVGHLMTGLPGSPTTQGIDDAHEALGAQLLGGLFGPAVGEPVALHVQAKRYLVTTQAGYRQRLSPDSVRSLALQGGPMTDAEAAAFMLQPHARDALRVRIWDDLAKDPGQQPASAPAALANLRTLMQQVLQAA